jgi:two-component system response regulator FlrC
MPEALHILVVEDDAPLRDAVCLTLELAGHAVTGVGDGPAALAEVDRQAFNLVLSDLKMQPMDGLQLLGGAASAPAPTSRSVDDRLW